MSFKASFLARRPSFLFFLMGLLSLNLALATNPNGDLEIELLSGSNLIIAQNANGPELVYLGAKITNKGDNAFTDLSVSIGDFDLNTPGIYPSRAHSGLSGSLSLKHLSSGSPQSDAFRFIGSLAPGESVVQYWLVEYPRTDQNGVSVSLTEAVEDDLWLEYDVWASAQDAGAQLIANTSQTLNFRLEESKADIQTRSISAQDIPSRYADLLQSMTGENSDTQNIASAGQSVAVTVWHQLGQIKDGFDANEDLVPDFNAFLQPVGRLATFDPTCFRLIRTSGVLLLEDASGNSSFTSFSDKANFTNIDRENQAVMALVNYEFMVIGANCEASLSPYQSVANQFQLDRFNQNYGSPIGDLEASAQQFSIKSNTLDSIPLGNVLPLQYQLSHTSPEGLGRPQLAAGASVHAILPLGTSYVRGSASSEQAVLFSTDNGSNWQTTEPQTPNVVTDILWVLEATMSDGDTHTFDYQVSIPNDFAAQYVEAEISAQIQGGISLASENNIIPIAANQTFSGQIFADTGSDQQYANGVKDNSETGIDNLKLALYLDLNGNAILEPGEPLIRQQTTDVNGDYQFSSLPAANFMLVLDTDSSLVSQTWLANNGTTHYPISLTSASQTGQKIGLSPLINYEHELVSVGTAYEGQLLRFEVSLEHMFENAAISLVGSQWTESYNPAQMSFVSANPAPSSIDHANGKLTWNNIGTMQAGQELEIEILFRPASTNYTQDYVVQLVSDIANISLSDHRTFALLSDTLNQIIRPSGSISGYVWNDLSGNVEGWSGNTGFETTDGFIPQVKLLAFACESSSGERLNSSNVPKKNQSCTSSINDGTWVVVDSVYTQADGSYRFEGLGEGYFYVALDEASLPANNVAKGDPDENATCSNCDASWGDSSDKLQDLNVVDASTDHQNINFGYAIAAGLSGQIWHDINGNGLKDPLEPGISEFPVELISNGCSEGVDCPIVATDSEGYYRFEGLVDSKTYTLNLGTHAWSSKYVFHQTAESDASLNESIQQTISNNQWNHALDFGFQLQGAASLTIETKADWNGNLAQDASDEGIKNVWVSLYFDADKNGAFDANQDPQVSISQTNAQGQVVFNNLLEGTYFHQVQIQDHRVLGQSQLIGDPDESNARCEECDAIGKTSFAAGQNSANAIWYFQPLGTYSFEGIVWQDQNADSEPQSSIEEAIENISVSLAVDLNQDGTFAALETQSSDALGAFRFAELIDASYQITIDAQDTDLPQNANGSLYQATNPTQSVANLSEGIISFNTQSETRLRFGFSPLASVGDVVFWDFDGDGQRDALEQGIAGVEVCLCLGQVDPCTSTNAILTTTTSDGTDGKEIGAYLFEDLMPASYTIGVKTTTQPISNATQTASPASLGETCQGDCNSQYQFVIENGRDIKGIDFGYEAKGVMGGTFWLDINNNKVMDAGEQGLADQTIALIPPSRVDIGGGRGLAVIKTTNANGQYAFYDLPDGLYRLSAKAPVGYVLSNDGDGDINGLAYIYIRSGKVAAIGRSYCTDCDMDANIGLRVGGYYSISGQICLDDPSIDGSCNNASLDQGLAGYKVLLSSADGTYLGMVDTDEAGNYNFPNLNPGTYNVSLPLEKFPLNLASLSTDVNQSVASQIIRNSEQTTMQVILGSSNLSGVDFAYELSIAFDLGSLPLSYYERTGFAYHIIDDNNTLFLGQQLVLQSVSLSSISGYVADNSIANNLDDGISFLELSSWQDGTVADNKGGSVQAEASADGWIVGWIDFNQDQDFLDQGEMILNQAASAGSNVYNFDIPAGSALNQTYFSRFRFFESEPDIPLVSFTGGALGGEIEDYSIDFSSLPVELVSFEAEQGPQGIELSWVTASEENTYGFDIERSIDGLLFNSIGQVDAAGNSGEIQFYGWDDQSVANLDFPKLYYRLKMIDLDGSFTYSQIESVNLTQASDFSLMLAPSPPLDVLKVEFTANPEQAADFVIVNSLGQIMWRESLVPQPGVNHWEHPVTEYLAGVYFLRLVSGQEKRVIKFIIN